MSCSGIFSRRQNVIHQAGSNRAPGHSVVFCRFRILNHYHAALPLDFPQTKRALGAGAGQDNGYRLFLFVVRQGPKKEIYGLAQTTRGVLGSMRWSFPCINAMSRSGGIT